MDDVLVLAGVLKAVADPTRLRILALLEQGEVCVCHIHDSLRISQTKASRHLAYLRRAGLVHADKRGLWVHYHLATPRLASVARVLAALRREVGAAQAIERDRTRLARMMARDDAPPRQSAGCCAACRDGACAVSAECCV